MFIFNSFSVGFSTLVSFNCFCLMHFFPFLKQKSFVSATECLTQRGGGDETISNVNIIMWRDLLCKKKGVSSVDKKITKKCP